MTQRTPRRSPLFAAIHSALRPSAATAAVVGLALATAGPVQAAMENGAPGKAALRPENLATRDEILFVDAQVADPRRLLVGAKQGVETVILEDGRAALEQITAVLESRRPVAVHLVAHGDRGRLRLGDTWLDAKQLDANLALIRRWFAGSDGARTPDLLLYACNLGEGSDGVAFVEKLAELSGADVAASDDVTGHGGDWDLEVQTGDIEAELAFSEITVQEYRSTLATFTVNTTNDNDGSTESCDEYCTLRDAIYAADENGNEPTIDSIVFGLGGAKQAGAKGTTYVINIDEDFDISEPVRITGPGMANLAIESEGESRIFHTVVDDEGEVYITDMTLRDAYAELGGCILSYVTDLTIDEVYFYDCDATDSGGAIYFYGDIDNLTIRNSVFDESDAEEYGGGAVFFEGSEGSAGGGLVVENSVFTENYAEDSDNENAGGGAILAYLNEDSLTVRDSEFRYNYSEEAGGGAIAIIDEGDSTILVENSAFYENAALEESAGGGGMFVYMEGTEITVQESTFIENDAGYYGGGAIQLWDSFEEGAEASEVLIEDSYFAENYTYGAGGAIKFDTAYDSTLTIRGSQFIDNESDEDGGALAAWGESGSVEIHTSFFADNSNEEDGGAATFEDIDYLTIYASTFYGNYASENAGGIEINNVEEAEIVNSTFSFNSTEGEGGGIQVTEESNVGLRNSTVAFNYGNEGGGVSFFGESMVIENSILGENAAGGGGPDLYGNEAAVYFSLISDTEEASIEDNGGNIFDYGADLGPLDDSQGPTPVHVPNPDSPVIDSADPAFSGPPDFDQRGPGFPRVVGRLDMGSVETGILSEIPTLSRWGLALMGLLMGALSFIGFKARRRENRET